MSETSSNPTSSEYDQNTEATEQLETQERFLKPSIRIAAAGDALALKHILETWIRDSGTGEILTDDVTSVMNAIEESTQGESGKQYVIAEDQQGNPVGVMGTTRPGEDMKPFVSTDSPIELINAYVDPLQRSTGTGTLLADYLEEVARSTGFTELIVNSGPRYKNTGWAFWSGRYGEPVAIQKDLYGPGGDAPVWRKFL